MSQSSLTCALILVASLALQGCGDDVDKAVEQSEAWRKTIDDAVVRIESTMDKAALSVPGERHMRLIDAARDPRASEEDREWARQYARRLFGLEIDAEYELVVEFAFDERMDLDALVTTLPVDSTEAVEHYCLTQGTYNPTPVRNTIRTPPSFEAASHYIDEQLFAAIDTLGIKVSNVRNTGGAGPQMTSFRLDRYSALNLPIYSTVMPMSLADIDFSNSRVPASITRPAGPFTAAILEQTDQRRKAAQHLRNALDAIYGDMKLPLDNSVVRKPFLPLGGRPFLVIMIEASQLEAQPSGAFRATGIVYRKQTPEEIASGAPRTSLNSQHVITLTWEHFEARGIVECGTPARRVYWAAHNMTDAATMSQEVYSEFLKAKELRRAWERELHDANQD